MKDEQILLQLEQLARQLEIELSDPARDTDSHCRLQDAKEHLRRAWHVITQIPTEFNDLIL